MSPAPQLRRTPKSLAIIVTAGLALAGAALSQAPAQAAAVTLTEVNSPRIIQRASAATWTFTTNPAGASGQVTLTLTPLTVPGETLGATYAYGARTVTVAANTLQPGYYDVTAAFPEADTWTGSLVVVDGTVAQEARMGMDTQMSWDAIECSTALGCRDTKDETIKWEGPNMPARTQWAIELMQLMGIGSVRDRQEWTCGSWVRPAARYMSQFLHGAGFNVDVNTAWSANCEDGSVPNFDRVPLDYDTVYQWGYEFATQHGANVNSVEYGNESVGATSHGGWPFQYASGLKAFSAGVKSVNPNIKILTAAGLSDYWRWDWSLLFEQEALANGTANDFDVRNMHVYPSGLATIADAPYGYSATASYTQLDQAAGIGGKGVWLTETGYNLKSQPMAIAEVEQAAYMIEAYTLGFASGFERIYPYILHSADDCGSNVGCHNSYGLTRNALDSEWLDGLTQDMSPRPAIASIAALSRLIQGRAVEQVERTSTGATVYFAGNVAVTWDSSRPLSAYGNVSAKNMYGRAVTAALSTVTPDKSHPYLLTGVTIRPGNAEAAVAPNPSTAAAANPFRLEAAHVYLNGADLGTTAATSRTDPGSTVTTNLHDSTVPVSQGDVVRIEARARDAQNNNVATSTQFTCQAGAGLTLQSQGLTGGNYYCQYLVGQVSSRSRTYGSGYPWSVPSYVQVVGSRAGNTDTSRVALSSSAVVTISGRGYLGQQMTASTTVSGVTWAWYRVDYNGQETPATNANGNLYTVGAGDFAYNTWGMGVRIVARAYKDGQMVAEGYFRPSRWPVEGWASAEGLTASDGTIRLAGNAWSFDWDHLESGGAFLVTVGGTCSAGGEQHLVKANQPWLESQALEYPQVVGGLYGFDVTFTTQLRGQQMVHVYPIAATWQIGDACPSEDATSHGDANEKVLDLGNSPVEVQVVEFTGRGYWGQQMTASTVVTGVTWSWFRIGFDGVESPVTNGNAVGNVYTVGAGDFAYNTWGQGVKIVARAYKSGQLVAEGFFRPSRLPVEGWASAEGLSAANGTVHFAGNAWAFDWDHLTAGGSFLVTLGGTCSAGGERHLVKANRQWLEWSQAGEYPQVVGGLYGFDATFTTQLHGLQTVNVYPVAATWQVGDVCPSEDATSHGSANGSVLDLGTAVEPLALSSVVLAGSATVGSRLTVTASYTPADAVVNYVWYRGTSVIQGVSGTSYTLTALDAGKDLVVKVTASHGGVTTAAKYSNHVLVPGQPLALNAVVLSGSATVGSQLTVAAGYTPLNAAVNYVWYRGTSVIQGVTGTAYTLTAADAGQDLVVKVTASFGGVTTAAKYSNHLIVLGVSRLAVVGTAQVGRVLTVDLAYAPAGAVVEYRWYRGVSVVGTAANYVVQPADVGQDMVLKVTVSLAGVGSYSRYSAHFFPVV